MTKKILVTGSEGYIGQHLCSLLEQRDFDVHKLDSYIEEPGAYKFKVDLRKPQDIKSSGVMYNDYDTIIHLAALVQVGQSVEYPTAYYNTNINGTNWLRNIVSHKKFIFASTGAAEGMTSPYAISKRVAEQMLIEQEPNCTIFRFYNVIGSDGFEPTNPDGLFYNLIQSIKTGEFTIYGNDYDTKDGTAIREYVHVMDVCRALIEAIDNPSTSRFENLAYCDTRTVKEIAQTFFKVNGVNCDIKYAPRRPGDLEACYLENPSPFMKRKYTYEEMLKWKPLNLPE
jgi:UDP-glucose 4-epimerase